MGDIEDIYEDLDADVELEEFREAVEAKVEQMGGLADEETAAMLIAHDLTEGEVEGIADIEAGMEEVKFVGKVISVGDLRTFERDGDDDEGRVCNIEVADETGRIRVALWDDDAAAAQEELATGQVLRVAGRPKEGYNGLEVSADRVEGDDEVDVDVEVGETATAESLSLGQSDVNLAGRVLGTDEVRTFSRDDGSEGRVANITLGDETGRVRVTLWDGKADLAAELDEGVSVEVVDGYVRERDGSLELHVGDRGAVEQLDEDVTYVPDTTAIDAVEIGETVDIAGVVRSADPKRTFDRDDGSEGQVRNLRLQDDSGDIRVALWGDKADKDIGPGDEVLCTDVEIQDGWQDELEASAGWRSTVSLLDDGATATADVDAGGDANDDADEEPSEQGLGAFADGESPDTGPEDATDDAPDAGETTEFTGTVVQTGDPVMLDNGEEAVTVETSANVKLGEEVTARGRMDGDRLDADEVF
ncbi:single-stranded DNA binding protein [Halorarius halobius]|uniref:single-stranded DNA binding protein n=1 Tax=Halorarius halobius TaxID=2962671 RepID=UPI0020CDC6B5|nr:single-stranded DNA binding protein [Halorarius halobius]